MEKTRLKARVHNWSGRMTPFGGIPTFLIVYIPCCGFGRPRRNKSYCSSGQGRVEEGGVSSSGRVYNSNRRNRRAFSAKRQLGGGASAHPD